MEFDIGSTIHGKGRLQALIMARGEYCLEVVDDGDLLLFVLVRGCIQVTRQRARQPALFCLHATPTAPLLLRNEGTYVVVAERNVLGFRVLKRRP